MVKLRKSLIRALFVVRCGCGLSGVDLLKTYIAYLPEIVRLGVGRLEMCPVHLGQALEARLS